MTASGAACGEGSAREAGFVLIYATFPSLIVAERIGGELVEAGLAACVNLIPGMRSIYRWQGALQRDEEVAAIVKTRASLLLRVVGWVRVSHPYLNPALVALPAIGGSAEFLAWIGAETMPACPADGNLPRRAAAKGYREFTFS